MRAPAFLHLTLIWLICRVVAPIRICAFNAQRFGAPKIAKSDIRATLVKILVRCDICLLQEVQDAKGQAVKTLLEELNRVHGSDVFSHISSAALGRKTYQEKYVFIYRLDKAKVINSYQYEDMDPANPDVFAREPFIVRFRLLTSVLKDLVLVPQHTSPQNAVKEIDALFDVFQAVQYRWKPTSIMLLGDFNADCDYVAKKRWPQIRLRVEPSLTWLIGDEVDTTVRANTNCAYDRIVIYGEKLKKEIVSGSAVAYNFQEKLGLTEAQILARCDISLVQEVRDSKGEVIPALIKELNRFDASHQYTYLESKRLGRNSYKEQYVYIYRSDVVAVMDWYQYPQNQQEDENGFAREPLIVRFQSPKTVIKDFVLVSLHTCPRDAAKEIQKLFRVMDEVRIHWKTENIMLLGDLNAACGYLTLEDWKSIRLRSGDQFHWLISDKDDTTVSHKTHCAYDRIVVHGEEFLRGLVPGSAKPFNFAKKLGLSEEEALEVSDHFPVEVNLRPDRRTDREL